MFIKTGDADLGGRIIEADIAEDDEFKGQKLAQALEEAYKCRSTDESSEKLES